VSSIPVHASIAFFVVAIPAPLVVMGSSAVKLKPLASVDALMVAWGRSRTSNANAPANGSKPRHI
jgi:hypothetical protein